jgi:hypothetical protein
MAGGDNLATFLFERRTEGLCPFCTLPQSVLIQISKPEAFLRSKGFKVADRSLSKRARKAQVCDPFGLNAVAAKQVLVISRIG